MSTPEHMPADDFGKDDNLSSIPSMSTETPRTEAEKWNEAGGAAGWVVTADFARTLETELTACLKELSELRDNGPYRRGWSDGERSERDRAEKWKADAVGLAEMIRDSIPKQECICNALGHLAPCSNCTSYGGFYESVASNDTLLKSES